MASGISTASVRERIQNGEDVFYLHFRFSIGHGSELPKVHMKVEERGWQKLPDFESTFVFFGSDPPKFCDILKEFSYENHVCRYMTGTLSECDVLEGTGSAPAKNERKSLTPGSTPGLLKYYKKVEKASETLDKTSETLGSLDLEQDEQDEDDDEA